jgi:hypothetical protein
MGIPPSGPCDLRRIAELNVATGSPTATGTRADEREVPLD